MGEATRRQLLGYGALAGAMLTAGSEAADAATPPSAADAMPGGDASLLNRSLLLPGTRTPLSIAADLALRVSVQRFGAIGDGDHDDTDAFNAAIASRLPISVPQLPGKGYRIAGKLVDGGGARMYGVGLPRIVVDHAHTFLLLSGEGSIWQGFRFEPRAASTEYGIDVAPTAHDNRLHDFEIVGGNSGVRISGARNRLHDIRFHEMRGTCIRLQGSTADGNVLSRIAMRNGALAGILHEDGAHHNIVIDASKWVEPALFDAFLSSQREAEHGRLGGDVCAYTAECHHNHAYNVRCEGARDGCFTFSGDDNVLDGAIFTNGAASGCAISGSRNKISNVQAIGCKTGFWIIPQAGGTGKDNVLIACQAENSETFGFRQEGSAYRTWAPALTRSPPTHFCAYGLNIYQCSPATQRFGTRPPTHTHGTVSDGVVDWMWVGSDPSTLDADRNVAIGCTAFGSRQADWQINGKGRLTRIGCPGDEAPQPLVRPQALLLPSTMAPGSDAIALRDSHRRFFAVDMRRARPTHLQIDVAEPSDARARMALYDHGGASAGPDALLADAGEKPCSVAGPLVFEITGGDRAGFKDGWLWIMLQLSGPVSLRRARCGQMIHGLTDDFETIMGLADVAAGYGPPPAQAGSALSHVATAPLCGLRAAVLT